MKNLKTIQTTNRSFFDTDPIAQRSLFKTMDWDIVKEYIENNKDNIHLVEAGLAEDFLYTSCVIFDCLKGFYTVEEVGEQFGKPFFSSNWATPCFRVHYHNTLEIAFESWKEGYAPDDYFGEKLS